uniref:Septin-type G domain-containing protein n=1 Tax=Callithrix jacchus TaxID=9483 RepID=A0A8I3WMB8_CALJA
MGNEAVWGGWFILTGQSLPLRWPQFPPSPERIMQTVEITKHAVDIEEKGVRLRLTIVDTPGFGDAVNNTECWKPVAEYIDQQFEQYFRDESGLNRKNIQDNRVHCCLYFISPFGHRKASHLQSLAATL